ncbi:MAG: hypothetical protein M5R42_09475 [Rhodocyclaceae bacterium]|nr:hypothetical protein [Rhodocyclaceae bacterium]
MQEGLRRLGELGGEVWFMDAGIAENFRRINNVDLSPDSVVRTAPLYDLVPDLVQTCCSPWMGSLTDVDVSAYLDVLAGRLRNAWPGSTRLACPGPPCNPEGTGFTVCRRAG